MPNKMEPDTRIWICCALLDPAIQFAILLDEDATSMSQGNAETVTMTPNMKSWSGTEPVSGTTNWGKKARKNKAVLGLVISTTMLSKNIALNDLWLAFSLRPRSPGPLSVKYLIPR